MKMVRRTWSWDCQLLKHSGRDLSFTVRLKTRSFMDSIKIFLRNRFWDIFTSRKRVAFQTHLVCIERLGVPLLWTSMLLSEACACRKYSSEKSVIFLHWSLFIWAFQESPGGITRNQTYQSSQGICTAGLPVGHTTWLLQLFCVS